MSLEEEAGGAQHGPVERETPEKIFEKKWATMMVDGTVEALRREYEASGKGERFEILQHYMAGHGTSRYGEIGERLGMTEDSVKVAIHRMRRRFGKLLREEIARTVADADEVEDELRYLISVLAG